MKLAVAFNARHNHLNNTEPEFLITDVDTVAQGEAIFKWLKGFCENENGLNIRRQFFDDEGVVKG